MKPTVISGKAINADQETLVKLSKAQCSEELQQKWGSLEPGLTITARVLG